MKNAHLRTSSVELHLTTRHTATRVRAFSDRFAIGQDKVTHMLSVFGGDSEIAAMSAALATNTSLTATLPDGKVRDLYMGDKLVTYRSHLRVPGAARPVRHLLAFSESIANNGQLGQIYLLDDDPELIWASTVSFLGLPASPEWAPLAVEWMRKKRKIEQMDGFNCSPVHISAGREEMLEWIGRGVKKGILHFPSKNGPIVWPSYSLDAIFRVREVDQAAA